jgi:hypothetical protein
MWYHVCMPKKMQTYRMDAGTETVGQHKATTPNRALREFFGDDLARSDGRYGRLKDGRECVALLVHGGRQYRGGHEWGR